MWHHTSTAGINWTTGALLAIPITNSFKVDGPFFWIIIKAKQSYRSLQQSFPSWLFALGNVCRHDQTINTVKERSSMVWIYMEQSNQVMLARTWYTYNSITGCLNGTNTQQCPAILNYRPKKNRVRGRLPQSVNAGRVEPALKRPEILTPLDSLWAISKGRQWLLKIQEIYCSFSNHFFPVSKIVMDNDEITCVA